MLTHPKGVNIVKIPLFPPVRQWKHKYIAVTPTVKIAVKDAVNINAALSPFLNNLNSLLTAILTARGHRKAMYIKGIVYEY